MPATRVDFKEIRSQVGFADLLEYYGVELKSKGDQLQGFCPLPNHQGKKKSPSFSVNAVKNIFQCFGCGAKGNVLDFAVLMENLDPDNGGDVRKVALALQERHLGVGSEARETPKRAAIEEEQDPPARDAATVINAPLDFELKTLDAAHPYLRKRGLSEETVETFGLGYCLRGLMKGRLCIPLHDMEGRLIGYAGRLVDESAIGVETPKYLLPGRRERDGTVHQFSKAEFLFNGFRIPGPVSDLVVVEGFFGAMWLHQHGFHAVALMGSRCSERQADLISDLVAPDGRVWMMPDGDDAGMRLARETFPLVGAKRQMRCVIVAGKDPEDLSAQRLSEIFE